MMATTTTTTTTNNMNSSRRSTESIPDLLACSSSPCSFDGYYEDNFTLNTNDDRCMISHSSSTTTTTCSSHMSVVDGVQQHRGRRTSSSSTTISTTPISELYHDHHENIPKMEHVVPDNCGLMIRLVPANENTSTTNTTVTMNDRQNDNVSSYYNNNHTVDIQTNVIDQHYPYIHPNCYAPAILQHVQLLYGGGSGTSVFYGYHPIYQQSIVMKHGNYHDIQEVFALITIATELQRRRCIISSSTTTTTKCIDTTTNTNTTVQYAVERMKHRIPEFVFVYISRHHLRDRNTEVWATLRDMGYTPSGRRLSDPMIQPLNHHDDIDNNIDLNRSVFYNSLSSSMPWRGSSNLSNSSKCSNNNNNNSSSSHHRKNVMTPTTTNHKVNHPKYHTRSVRIIPTKCTSSLEHNNPIKVGSDDDDKNTDDDDDENVMEWSVGFNNVDIPIPLHIYQQQQQQQTYEEQQQEQEQHQQQEDIAHFFHDFSLELQKQSKKHNWKVTLGQKYIGGNCIHHPNNMDDDCNTNQSNESRNGADILTSGQLQDDLLDTLLHGIMSVMHDLDILTLPEERQNHFDTIKYEVQQLQISHNIYHVSKQVDLFVGRSIIKNFHPIQGRFVTLRWICNDFHSYCQMKCNFNTNTNNTNTIHTSNMELYLNENEQIPAHFLGLLVQPNMSMNDVFINPPSSIFTLNAMEQSGWMDILLHATQFCQKSFAIATDCLWTCGLTDAGLHNTFLSVDRGLELFDLGEPGLEPRPAFLTKFFMSFFHTLGMENEADCKIWKKRFYVVCNETGEQRLALTSETTEKIPYLHNVFMVTLDHIMTNIFDNDDCVRKLIIKYVVLQLLSDASFCLQRWEAKGGGVQRFGDRVNDPLEKWLWRSLWDLYIASYVHTHLLLEQ